MKSSATKQALSDSLKTLLGKKPITKITINEITDGCGTSRMTFYYYFTDIYDLAKWTLEESVRNVLGDYRTFSTWQKGFSAILQVLKNNQPLVLNVFHSIDRAMFEQYMLQEVEKLILNVVREQSIGLTISEEGKHRVAQFYSYALLGVVIEWITRGMTNPVTEVVSMTAAIIHGDFRNSLENVMRMERQAQSAHA